MSHDPATRCDGKHQKAEDKVDNRQDRSVRWFWVFQDARVQSLEILVGDGGSLRVAKLEADAQRLVEKGSGGRRIAETEGAGAELMQHQRLARLVVERLRRLEARVEHA